MSSYAQSIFMYDDLFVNRFKNDRKKTIVFVLFLKKGSFLKTNHTFRTFKKRNTIVFLKKTIVFEKDRF